MILFCAALSNFDQIGNTPIGQLPIPCDLKFAGAANNWYTFLVLFWSVTIKTQGFHNLSWLSLVNM